MAITDHQIKTARARPQQLKSHVPQATGAAYNPHLGAAISLIMMFIVVLCMSIMNKFGEGEEQAVVM